MHSVCVVMFDNSTYTEEKVKLKNIVPVGRDITAMNVAGDWLIWSEYRKGWQMQHLKTDEIFFGQTSGDIAGLGTDGEQLGVLLWQEDTDRISRNSLYRLSLQMVIENRQVINSAYLGDPFPLPYRTRAICYGNKGETYLGMTREIWMLKYDANYAFIQQNIIGQNRLTDWVTALAIDRDKKKLFCAVRYKEVRIFNLETGRHRKVQDDLEGYTIMALAYKDEHLFMGVCGTEELQIGALVMYDLKKNKVVYRIAIPTKVFPSALAFYGDELLIASNAPTPLHGGIGNFGNPFHL